MSVFRFRVFFSDGEFKNTKTMFCKQIVSKRFYKKSTKKQQKIQKRLFFSICFNHVFGHFSVKLKKSIKNIGKTEPGPFLASDLPTYPRGSLLFFGGPLIAIQSYDN
jgi:hypothetical protein